MPFIVLTGASSSGKTAIAEAIACRYGEHVDVYHFDRMGVPSADQMTADYGSVQTWQRSKTHDEWRKLPPTVRRRATYYPNGRCDVPSPWRLPPQAGIHESPSSPNGVSSESGSLS